MKINAKALGAATRNAFNLTKSCTVVGGGLKLEAKKDKLVLISSNGSEWLKEEIEADGNLELSGCVNPRLLLASLTLADEEVELKLTGSGQLTVRAGASTLLGISSADEFPAVPAMTGAKQIAEDGKLIGSAIDTVAFCSYKDETRPVLRSVSVIGDGKQLVVQASNGGSAAFVVVDSACICELLVSASHALPLATALNHEGSKLFVKDGLLSVKHETGAYCCRQLEGKFPDTSRIRLGTDEDAAPSNKIGKINRGWLSETLSAAISVHADEASNASVALSFSESGLQVETPNFSRKFAGKFPKFEARFGAALLLACANSFSVEEIEASATPLNCLHLDVPNYKTVNLSMRTA